MTLLSYIVSALVTATDFHGMPHGSHDAPLIQAPSGSEQKLSGAVPGQPVDDNIRSEMVNAVQHQVNIFVRSGYASPQSRVAASAHESARDGVDLSALVVS